MALVSSPRRGKANLPATANPQLLTSSRFRKLYHHLDEEQAAYEEQELQYAHLEAATAVSQVAAQLQFSSPGTESTHDGDAVRESVSFEFPSFEDVNEDTEDFDRIDQPLAASVRSQRTEGGSSSASLVRSTADSLRRLYKQRESELLEQSRRLESSISRSSLDKDELKQKARQLLLQLESSQEKVQRLEMEMRQRRQESARSEENARKLQSTIEAYENEITLLKALLEDRKADIQRLNDRAAQSEERERKAVSALSEVRAEKLRSESSTTEKDQKLREAQQESDELRRQLAAANSRNIEMAETMEEQRRTHAAEVEDLQAQLRATSTKLSTVEGDAAKMHSQHAELSRQFEELNMRFSALQKDTKLRSDATSRQLDFEHQRFQHVKQGVAALQHGLRESTGSCKQWLSDMKFAVTSAQSDVTDMLQSCMRAVAQHVTHSRSQRHADIAQLKAQVEDLKHAQQQQEAAAKEWKLKYQGAEASLRSMTEQEEELVTELERNRSEIAQLKEDLATSTACVEELQGALNEASTESQHLLQWKQELTSATSQLKELREQLEEAEWEKERLKESVEELRNEASVWKRQAETDESSLQDAMSNESKAIASLRKKEVEQERLESLLSQLRDQLTGSQSQVNELLEAKAKLQRDIAVIEKERDEALSSQREGDDALLELQTTVHKKDSDLDRVRQSLQEETETSKRLLRQVNELQKERTRRQDEFNAAMRRLQEQSEDVSDLQSRLNEAQTALHAAQLHNSSLEQSVSESSEHFEALRSSQQSIKALQNSLFNSTEMCRMLEKSLEATHAELLEQQELAKEKEMTIHRLHQELESAQKDNRDYIFQLDSMSAETAKLQRLYEAQVKAAEKANSEKRSLLAQIDSQQAQESSITARLHEVEATLKEMTHRVETAEQDKVHAVEALNTLQAASAQDKEGFNVRKRNMEEELLIYEERLVAMQHEKREMEAKVADLEAQLLDKEDEMRQLRGRMKDIVAKEAASTSALHRATEELEAARERDAADSTKEEEMGHSPAEEFKRLEQLVQELRAVFTSTKEEIVKSMDTLRAEDFQCFRERSSWILAELNKLQGRLRLQPRAPGGHDRATAPAVSTSDEADDDSSIAERSSEREEPPAPENAAPFATTATTTSYGGEIGSKGYSTRRRHSVHEVLHSRKEAEAPRPRLHRQRSSSVDCFHNTRLPVPLPSLRQSHQLTVSHTRRSVAESWSSMTMSRRSMASVASQNIDRFRLSVFQSLFYSLAKDMPLTHGKGAVGSVPSPTPASVHAERADQREGKHRYNMAVYRMIRAWKSVVEAWIPVTTEHRSLALLKSVNEKALDCLSLTFSDVSKAADGAVTAMKAIASELSTRRVPQRSTSRRSSVVSTRSMAALEARASAAEAAMRTARRRMETMKYSMQLLQEEIEWLRSTRTRN